MFNNTPMKKLLTVTLVYIFLIFGSLGNINAQTNSSARDWNELILEGIRNDFARPTIHARNLFHHSIICYDAWAAYDSSKEKYFLGETLNGYICEFTGVDFPADINADIDEARNTTIAYASYRFIQNRYSTSPDYAQTFNLINNYMLLHGYDISITSTQYETGGPAELGNYLAEQIQLYGYTDGSNELGGHVNTYYTGANPPIVMEQSGNPDIIDPNRWQAITLTSSIDQSGNPVLSTPEHLSPEWGDVTPFSLDASNYQELIRDGQTYKVYADTNAPAYLNLTDSSEWDSFYKWNHALVPIWQSHLDPADGVMWDISPASIGNNTWYPTDSSQYPAFYNLTDGGDPGIGHALNPITGLPYTPQIVPRGDYARVLAEFWADGLDSETPPGHWFEIYHYVTDQPTFERKWKGLGVDLDTLEYDVKAHLTLSGAMHDAAICSWSLKGYYDYIRPVSAIRYMADRGQSTDTLLASYDPNGIPLLAGYIELVQIGDPLAGASNENVGKIKLFTWKGPEYITDPLTDIAGVDWILAENWWPYQRPTFVTPPFAGFVSGHSTFSRAGAQIMEFMTGSEYFPGGLGEFEANQNDYLLFENGPSVPITLQWATYRDASDQCSLSRLWGGIHPPIDDIPGRMIGEQVGITAFNLADSIFASENSALISIIVSDSVITIADIGSQLTMDFEFNLPMDTSIVATIDLLPAPFLSVIAVNQIQWIDSLNLSVIFDVLISSIETTDTRVQLDNLFSGNGTPLNQYTCTGFFIVDTKMPSVSFSSPTELLLSDSLVGTALYEIDIQFDEQMDTNFKPSIDHESTQQLTNTVQYDFLSSEFIDSVTFHAYFQILEEGIEVDSVNLRIQNAKDFLGNFQEVFIDSNFIAIDTKNPNVTDLFANDYTLDQLNDPFNVVAFFDEEMFEDINVGLSFNPTISLPAILNYTDSGWVNSMIYSFDYELIASPSQSTLYDVTINSGVDLAGNLVVPFNVQDFVLIDQVVGINELKDSKFQLYPTILRSGEIVFIQNKESIGETTLEFELISPIGQVVQEIVFQGNGSKFTSAPIIQPVGMYYLKKGYTTHKLIIVE